MLHEEAQQLKPGTLLCVREEMLTEDPESNSTLSLASVVDDYGYIYRFTRYEGDAEFPVKTTSLATGKHMEFYVREVSVMEERNDSLLLQVRGRLPHRSP